MAQFSSRLLTLVIIDDLLSKSPYLLEIKKRTKEGEIVGMHTDKTGNFAVIDRENYEEAGQAHVMGDKIVN